MIALNTPPSAPTLICGHCLQARTTSICECRETRWVRAARAAELAGRLVVERQGIASRNVMAAGGPMTRVHFKYGADR